MKKHILSLSLVLIMLLGLLPAAAMAAEETQYSAFTVPVELGDEAAEDQDQAQLFTLVDEDDYVYCYQGTKWWSSSKPVWVTASGEKPQYGTFTILDAEGQEVAVDEQRYISEDKDTGKWYTSSLMVSDMSQVAPGEYTLKMTDDAGKEYAVLTKLKVVPKGTLMLKSISVNNKLRPEQEEFEVYVDMYGFQKESDLTNLTITLRDKNNAAVAQSTGSYRISNNSGEDWTFYMQMKMLDGKKVDSTSYTLELAYPGDVELINAANVTSASAAARQAYIASVQVADPATGSVKVELKLCTPGTTYRLVATDGYTYNLSDLEKKNVYASVEVKPSAATTTVTLPMKLNGMTVPLSGYGQYFYFTLFGPDSNSNLDMLQNWKNPYNNSGSNPWINFQPYYVKTTTKSLPFVIRGDECAYWKGSGDVLTLTDKSGREMGRCTNMTKVTSDDGYQFSVSGTLTITGTLQHDTYYNVALNGVEFGGLRATSQLTGQMNVNSGLYIKKTDKYDFWTNLGEVALSADMIHSSGSGHFELVNAAGQTVITGPTVTGSDSDYYEHKYYACGITAAEAQSKLTDGTAYRLCFVDANGSRADLGYGRDLIYRAQKMPFTVDNSYINWWSMKSGDSSVSGQLYTYDSFRHVTWAEVETALKDLSLVSQDGSKTLTVKSVTLLGSRNSTTNISVELSGPVTAGTWWVMEQDVQRNMVEVKDGTEKISLWNVDLGTTCTISGQNLPADGAYTAWVFRDYAARTAEFALTLRKASSSSDRLEFPRSVVASLEEGTYQVRVYRNGTVLGDVEMYIPAKGHVTVEAYDSETGYYQNGLGIGNALSQSGNVSFLVSGDSEYIYLRCSEDRSALSKAPYTLLSDQHDGYALSAGDGEKTIYVQLKHVDGTESKVMEVKAWRMVNGPQLKVDSSVGGVCAERTFTVTASSTYASLNVYVEFLDAQGNPIYTSGSSNGKYDLLAKSSGSTVSYSRSFDLDNYSDQDLSRAASLRIQMCKGSGYNSEDVGTPVIRSIRFVDPKLDFGIGAVRPSSYRNLVAVYNADGQMIYVDVDPEFTWSDGKYVYVLAPEVCLEMDHAKLFGLNYNMRPDQAAARAEFSSQ